MAGLVSLLWKLLGDLNLQELVVYLGHRLFVPPAHIPITERLPGPLRMMPGVETIFETAVGTTRELYYYIGVGEGLVAGAIAMMLLVLIAKFAYSLRPPAKAGK